MAGCYEYLGKEERFVRAYAMAANVLSNMREPVDVYGDDVKALDALKGVGESIARKIIEYLHRQDPRLRTTETENPARPVGTDAGGRYRPRHDPQLHDELHISTRQELAARRWQPENWKRSVVSEKTDRPVV